MGQQIHITEAAMTTLMQCYEPNTDFLLIVNPAQQKEAQQAVTSLNKRLRLLAMGLSGEHQGGVSLTVGAWDDIQPGTWYIVHLPKEQK